MSISSASLSTTLAGAATQTSAQNIQSQIGIAVLKQMQDQQQQQAQALLKMIQSAPTLDGTGRLVNVAA